MLMYEDFQEGQVLELRPYVFTAAEIIAFAEQFDPQPFHLDAASDQAKAVGGLIASGWHTCSVFMRMMCDSYLLETQSQGSAGLEEVRWLKPVFAGDTISGTSVITGRRVLRSRPTMGCVEFLYTLKNQHGESVMRAKGMGFVTRRETGEAQ